MTIPTGNVQGLTISEAADCSRTSTIQTSSIETHMIQTQIIETPVR
jgi:hypothetical protein